MEIGWHRLRESWKGCWFSIRCGASETNQKSVLGMGSYYYKQWVDKDDDCVLSYKNCGSYFSLSYLLSLGLEGALWNVYKYIVYCIHQLILCIWSISVPRTVVKTSNSNHSWKARPPATRARPCVVEKQWMRWAQEQRGWHNIEVVIKYPAGVDGLR